MLITLFDILHFYKIVILTYSKNKYIAKLLENLRFKYVNNFKTKTYDVIICHRFELATDEYLKLKESYLPSLIEIFYT